MPRPKRAKKPSWRDLMNAAKVFVSEERYDDLSRIYQRFDALVPPSNAVVVVLSAAEARGLYLAVDEGRRAFEDTEHSSATPQQLLAMRRGVAKLATSAGCRNPYPDVLEDAPAAQVGGDE